ncbi:MAG: hypothetical protein RR521_10235 [Clostridia bacterium]
MKWEASLHDGLRKQILWVGVAMAALLGALARYAFIPFEIADNVLYQNWYRAAVENGLAAIAETSDYNALYLYLVTLVAKLGLAPMLAVKLIALGMEGLLIGSLCLLVHEIAPAAKKQLCTALCFILCCLNPAFMLNAAAWGQPDAGYVGLSVLSIWALTRGRSKTAMVFLGLALCLKLQALFLIPAYFIYYLLTKKIRLWEFFLIPALLLLSGLPMALVGKSPFFAVTCYFTQMHGFTALTMNMPNLYAILCNAKEPFQAAVEDFATLYGMALTAAALGGLLVWLVRGGARLNASASVLLGAWCVLCCGFFLPRMHERYAMVGEVLLLCWAICECKPRGFAYLLLGLLPTLSAYMTYLFHMPLFPLGMGGLMNLLLLCALTRELGLQSGTWAKNKTILSV